MSSYRSQYDTVILGAGLGGIVAGSILAKAGNKVLILEEKSSPGGLCSMERREGYPLARSPALLLGLEKDGYCDQLFSELGLSLALLKRPGGILKRPSPILQVVTDQYRINIEASRGEQLAEFKREWGDSVGGFLQFYRDLDAIDRVLYPVLYKKVVPGPPLPLRERIEVIRQGFRRRWMTHVHSRQSAKNYLSRYGFPREFLDLLRSLNRFWFRTDLGRISALHFLIHHVLMSREVVRPVGGVVKFCEAIMNTFQDCRGEIRYQQEFSSVKRESRKEWKISLKNGGEVRARRVVANYPGDFGGQKDYELITFFFVIQSEVIPYSMAEQLIVHGSQDPSSGRILDREGTLFIVLNLPEEEEGQPLKRLLTVSVMLKGGLPSDKEGLHHLLNAVTKRLHWLMPFSEGRIEYLGNDEQPGKNGSTRLAVISPHLKHLRYIRLPHIEFAYAPFDAGLYLLPDHASGMGMMSTEIRSAEVVAKRILKRP